DMRVLVTGGAGFIGSHFVHHLAGAGDEVVVLDKLTYAGNPANLDGVEHEFHQGDIVDPKAVARAANGCDAIVNFAAETHVDRSILGPAEFILTDVLGTQVLLDYARQHGIRHLQVSTDEVYGDIPPDADPCTEDAPLRPSSPYSASKSGGDIEPALRKGGAGEVYNVGGQERENMEVVRRILDLTGASPDLVRHVEDRPGHDRRYSVDSTKLQGLGWAPQHSFDAGGLAET